ncbi:membrane hypothetical protein [Frankia canadensis]|uniref:Uncharacterized protein n=1 Tax=Frankia canadensis TaxID=1836972 RepID=A0A2I2KN46_9ACTN|nr:hypothetical protein [Frankia canadensis]SNQ47091.1 membrane hypothetical protein [Frankia canadensis]SOU54381.1 membrane hypothetical protein [Frankia canadensis]
MRPIDRDFLFTVIFASTVSLVCGSFGIVVVQLYDTSTMGLFLMAASVVTATLPILIADRRGFGLRPGPAARIDRAVVRWMATLAALVVAASVLVGIVILVRDARRWQGYLLAGGAVLNGWASVEFVRRLLGRPAEGGP